MKSKTIFIGIFMFSIFVFSSHAQQDDFPVLKGPYLGQKPPGMTPEIFAPGIVSTEDKYELNAVFSPDGKEFYYEISTTTMEEKKEGKYFYIIMVSKQIDGAWTKPELAEFSGEHSIYDLCFAPDGNRIYFTSDRDDPWNTTKENHIWYINRLEGGWSEAKILGPPIYSHEGDGQQTITKDGSMYFRIGGDFYFSKYKNGEFQEPVLLGDEINSPYYESKPCLALDESYLLFVRYGMPETIDGGRGLYISFQNNDGSWTEAKNTQILGSLPKFSPDGKYFFFSKSKDVYWVDAKIIEDLKPKYLK